jgi:hypothetical protein
MRERPDQAVQGLACAANPHADVKPIMLRLHPYRRLDASHRAHGGRRERALEIASDGLIPPAYANSRRKTPCTTDASTRSIASPPPRGSAKRTSTAALRASHPWTTDWRSRRPSGAASARAK